MKAVIEGHRYELDNFEGKGSQVLQFIHKETNEEGDFVTIEEGTTNEEVLEVLINRIEYLNNKMWCRENELARVHLEEALRWLHRRTKARVEAGVEGTQYTRTDNKGDV